MKKLLIIGALVVTGIAAVAFGAGRLVLKDPSLSAVALSTTPSLTITTGQDRQTNQISLQMNVVKGTSAQLRVECQGSSDGVTFATLTSCSATTPHTCAQRLYNFDADLVASKTSWMLDVPSNYPIVKCTFDDPADGTGTISVIVIRGL